MYQAISTFDVNKIRNEFPILNQMVNQIHKHWEMIRIWFILPQMMMKMELYLHRH